MTSRPTIAIVGGGVAGTLTAVHLSRAASRARVILIERAPRFARGVAYSTRSSAHLLNVPAARMSAFPHDPEHFLRWVRARLDASTPAAAFLPRRLYGEYVAELLEQACARSRHCLERVPGTVIDVRAGSPARITFDDGTMLWADRVVLALGHSAPRDPAVRDGAAFYESSRYARDPWAASALDDVERDADLLLIGTGLTMYDVVLALRERGHVGTIHALSRRGLRPRSHTVRPLQAWPHASPDFWLRIEPTARALLRAVRMACDGTTDGGDWRGVIDSIRPITPQLWGRLCQRERARLLALVRPFWEVHRHRAAPDVHREIDRLVEFGALRLHTGRVRDWREDETGVAAVLDDRTIRVARVINCTGPDSDVHRSSDPLVRSLVARGLVVRDPLGLGIETADDGAVVGATGRTASWLFTLGTWRKPRLWESVAVPELRVQAEELARRLTQGFDTTEVNRSTVIDPLPLERALG